MIYGYLPIKKILIFNDYILDHIVSIAIWLCNIAMENHHFL